MNINYYYDLFVKKGATLKINQSNGNVLTIFGITDAHLTIINNELELVSGEIDATEYIANENEETATTDKQQTIVSNKNNKTIRPTKYNYTVKDAIAKTIAYEEAQKANMRIVMPTMLDK